eukprot:1663436-Pleurochrysis_carterae.AAC.1
MHQSAPASHAAAGSSRPGRRRRRKQIRTECKQCRLGRKSARSGPVQCSHRQCGLHACHQKGKNCRQSRPLGAPYH